MRYIEPRRLVASLSLPILFIVLILTVNTLWFFFDLPSDDELIALIRTFFDRYGYFALFICSLIEGALVLGFYFPGGVAIFLSVIVAGKDISRVATVAGIVSATFTLGLCLDYLLGKYGWYRLLLRFGFRRELDNAKRRLERHGLLAVVITYWDINLASFTATAAGILRYPFVRFLIYSAFFITLWNSLWATIIYFIGTHALRFVTGRGVYAMAVIGVWVLGIVLKHVLDNIRRARPETRSAA